MSAPQNATPAKIPAGNHPSLRNFQRMLQGQLTNKEIERLWSYSAHVVVSRIESKWEKQNAFVRGGRYVINALRIRAIFGPTAYERAKAQHNMISSVILARRGEAGEAKHIDLLGPERPVLGGKHDEALVYGSQLVFDQAVKILKHPEALNLAIA
ncbi:MAG: hypothetical protein SFW65_04010 [Alphaproteobacteria bacterium]|nr:hypothetical protein [Alphaproteobacteria bacterium]